MSINVSRSDFTRIVVAVDPAATATEDSDDTGIVVAARGPHQPSTCKLDSCPGHGYVLADATCHELPAVWAKRSVEVYDEWEADRIVAETNNGGDMVGTIIRSFRSGVPYEKVTATRGKRIRAEPASAMQEQGRIHFVGVFPELETQLTTWSPDTGADSPDRLDALVWALTALGLIGGTGAAFMTYMQEDIAKRAEMKHEPVELKRLPKHLNEVEKRIAGEKCRQGANHRFMEYGDGSYQCAVCGGFLDDQA